MNLTASSASGSRLRLWIAVSLPPSTWFLYEVGLAVALRTSCTAVGGVLGIGWGLASLAGCGAAAWLVWPRPPLAGQDLPSRDWLIRVAALAAGIFALAIAFQTVATWVVPPCAR